MGTIITKKYPEMISVLGEDRKVVLSPESKERIQDFINNHLAVICAYNNLEEWRVSNISTKYLSVNTQDTVGRIVSIDYDTRDVEIELLDDCNNPDSFRYINPDDYDKYQIKIRGLCSRVAGEPLGNDGEVSLKVVTFDLIKMEV